MSGHRQPYPSLPASTPQSGVPASAPQYTPPGPGQQPPYVPPPQQAPYAQPPQQAPYVQPPQQAPHVQPPHGPQAPYTPQGAPGMPMQPMAPPGAVPPVSRMPTLPSSHSGHALAQHAMQAMQATQAMAGQAGQVGQAAQASPPPMIPIQYPQEGHVLVSTRGTYTVQSVIGSGEFGAVYECTGPFDQVYALKMVRPANRPYSEVQAEWAKEVQRLLSLRHPNVVYIYDAFEQGHLFYLALERCDHALSAMLGVPMQEGLVLELARQLLAAVQFLHDNDVVHDDLHPGNVLIEHDTDRPIVKISDFGISHELRGQAAIRPNVVHHAIMAPEILATGYTSKQSDLYQIGLLLFWMLTGAPAVDMKAAYNDLVRQVADGEPRRRAEAIGTPLGSLIAKMLRRREAYRYTSAREVWADLRNLPAWQKRALFPVR